MSEARQRAAVSCLRAQLRRVRAELRIERAAAETWRARYAAECRARLQAEQQREELRSLLP